MHFLYRVQPSRSNMLTEGPTEQESDAISRHFSYLQALTEQKVVVLAGRTSNNDEKCFGIVIFQATSEQEARQLMNNDPAVKEGVMNAELFPFSIALLAKN